MNNLQIKINEKFPNENIEVLEYTIMKEPGKVKCLTCNTEYSLAKSENFVRSGKKCICKKCVNNGSGGRLTLEQMQAKIDKLYPDESLEVLNYTLKNEPCSIKCLKCGEVYTLQNAESFYNKSKKRVCSHCIPNKAEIINTTYNNFLDWVDKSEDFIYIKANDNRITSKTLIQCKCTKCGKINQKTMYDYMRDRGCTCDANNQLMSQEDYQLYLGAEYTALSEYKGKNHSIMMRHNLCGFCYKTNARFYHCPKCSGSKGEQAISFLLDSKNYSYIREYKVNIDNHELRFDFYLPELDLYIEYQGIQHSQPVAYFGGEDGFKKQVIYDNLKRDWIKKNNHNLLEIGYDENIESKLFEYLIKFNDHPERE